MVVVLLPGSILVPDTLTTAFPSAAETSSDNLVTFAPALNLYDVVSAENPGDNAALSVFPSSYTSATFKADRLLFPEAFAGAATVTEPLETFTVISFASVSHGTLIVSSVRAEVPAVFALNETA